GPAGGGTQPRRRAAGRLRLRPAPGRASREDGGPCPLASTDPRGRGAACAPAGLGGAARTRAAAALPASALAPPGRGGGCPHGARGDVPFIWPKALAMMAPLAAVGSDWGWNQRWTGTG